MENNIWGYLIAVLSSGSIVKAFDYLINRKKKKAESSSAEVEATAESFETLRLQIAHLKKSLDEAYATTQKMQQIINEFRCTNLDLTKELAAAQIELAKAQARVKGCAKCIDKK